MIPTLVPERALLDRYFLGFAQAASTNSKDPSTQTGCALVDHNELLGTGWNTFPPGVEATEQRLADRPTRLAYTVHAEVAAILSLLQIGLPTRGCTAYIYPWPPCAPCAGILVMAGIVRVVAPEPTDEQLERWGASMEHAGNILEEGGCDLHLVPR